MILSVNLPDCVMLQLLVKNPDQRLGMPTCPAGLIRDHPFFKPIDWNLIENRQMEPPVKPKIVRRIVNNMIVFFLLWMSALTLCVARASS
jgi:hypothetical protein